MRVLICMWCNYFWNAAAAPHSHPAHAAASPLEAYSLSLDWKQKLRKSRLKYSHGLNTDSLNFNKIYIIHRKITFYV